MAEIGCNLDNPEIRCPKNEDAKNNYSLPSGDE
jgi:hypothetical protein